MEGTLWFGADVISQWSYSRNNMLNSYFYIIYNAKGVLSQVTIALYSTKNTIVKRDI